YLRQDYRLAAISRVIDIERHRIAPKGVQGLGDLRIVTCPVSANAYHVIGFKPIVCRLGVQNQFFVHLTGNAPGCGEIKKYSLPLGPRLTNAFGVVSLPLVIAGDALYVWFNLPDLHKGPHERKKSDQPGAATPKRP